MKKILFVAQVVLFILFNLALMATLLQFAGTSNPLISFDQQDNEKRRTEEFTPSLSRLNTIDKLVEYCDSIYYSRYGSSNTSNYERNYTEVLSSVIRKRFYHGYSHYSFSNNYFAVLFSKATLDGYSAIVVPNDILKHPNAACSQQSIVMMEALHQKGFTTRKVGFKGKKSGHFCLEVYYNGSWHFYDTNMEPDAALLKQYDRPSVAVLAKNHNLLLNAYHNYTGEFITDLFSTYWYGPVNQFPAPRGIIFQKVSKVFSYSLWLFFLISFILVRRKLLQYSSSTHVRNSRIYFPLPERETSSGYYPGITAPGS